MPKKKVVRNHERGYTKNESLQVRAKIKAYYMEKFFNKFLSRFEFEGITYQQKAYIMRQFWSEKGTVALFKDKISGLPVFAPYTPVGMFNTYDYPTKVNLINKRGVTFIPSTPVNVDEEGGVVLLYIQKDRKGISVTIDSMVDKLVDIEMTIRTNLKAVKTPWVFAVSPEDEVKMKNLKEQLENDDPYIFVSLEELQLAKALVSGTNSNNLQLLENLRQQAENEILTRIGINNLGIVEKKEHLTNSEVASNNEQIASSGDEFEDCLNEGFDNAKEFLGLNISVNVAKPVQVCEDDSEESEDNEDYDE